MLVSNNFSTQTSYENQTKKAITNKFIQEAMTEFLARTAGGLLHREPQAMPSEIADQVLMNKRSRETAEKARLNIKKEAGRARMDIANRVQKFVDCRTKDVSRRELYIVEGDSALGACKLGRDAEFQGIMPVRGKILNCLKADYAKIFKSEIITDLLKVMGCGVEVNDQAQQGPVRLSTWTTCAGTKSSSAPTRDVDGFQIRTLILTMLYRLDPHPDPGGVCVHRRVPAV